MLKDACLDPIGFFFFRHDVCYHFIPPSQRSCPHHHQSRLTTSGLQKLYPSSFSLSPPHNVGPIACLSLYLFLSFILFSYLCITVTVFLFLMLRIRTSLASLRTDLLMNAALPALFPNCLLATMTTRILLQNHARVYVYTYKTALFLFYLIVSLFSVIPCNILLFLYHFLLGHQSISPLHHSSGFSISLSLALTLYISPRSALQCS